MCLYIRGAAIARTSINIRKPRRGLIGGKSLFNFKVDAKETSPRKGLSTILAEMMSRIRDRIFAFIIVNAHFGPTLLYVNGPYAWYIGL